VATVIDPVPKKPTYRSSPTFQVGEVAGPGLTSPEIVTSWAKAVVEAKSPRRRAAKAAAKGRASGKGRAEQTRSFMG
jgi:hypothetical protein